MDNFNQCHYTIRELAELMYADQKATFIDRVREFLNSPELQSNDMPDRQISSASEASRQAKKDSDHRESLRAKLGAVSELMFVVLPFIVIAITLAHRGELKTIFFLPEWSIVSAVIMGQSIVKWASIAIGNKVSFKEGIVFILSALLVVGLVPILIVLAIVLTADKVSIGLAYTQAIFSS